MSWGFQKPHQRNIIKKIVTADKDNKKRVLAKFSQDQVVP